MKQLFYFKARAWHRTLMLVCLLGLWQGMGWADNDRSNLCHQFYYDINGDGTLEYFAPDGIYTIDGKKLYSIDCGTYSMGLFDKDGHPLLVTTGPKVWDYKTAKYIFNDSKWNGVELADIDGDGRKELVELSDYQNLNDPGQYIKTYHLENDGTFVKGNMYVTSDTTTVKSITLDNYTPYSSGSLTTSIGAPGAGMFVEAKPFLGWTDLDEYDITEAAKAKQRSAITYSKRANSTALDLNGDGLEELMDYWRTYYNLGNNTRLRCGSPWMAHQAC